MKHFKRNFATLFNVVSFFHKFSVPWVSKYVQKCLTHWGWATHICVSKLTIIASDNGLSPDRRQAIIWNNAGILSIGLLWANFIEILIEILTFSFKKMRLKVSSAKWRPFCLGLNVLSQKVKMFSDKVWKGQRSLPYFRVSCNVL